MSRLLPGIYLVGTTVFLYVLFRDRAYDDPFITYRYAANLLHGLGFVYNPGEHVQSTTTPLFTLLLAGLGLLWDDLPHLAVLIGVTSLAAGGLLLWELARVWATPLVGWVGLILYPIFPLLIATLGSETPLYLALCLAAFYLYARRQYSLTGLFAGLATLARPDGILVAAILSSHFLLLRRERIPWSGIAVYSGLLLGWGIFAWIYFGSPLPVTLAAKQQQGAMAISQQFAQGFLTILKGYHSWPYLFSAGLAIIGISTAVWRRSSWLLVLSWTGIYFLSYSLLGVSRYFWYYAPLVPGYLAAAGLGITGVVTWLAPRTNHALPGSRWVLILAGGLILVLAFGQLRSLRMARSQPDNRLQIYRAVGQWLDQNTLPGESVGSLEVGIIGYYARRQMVDFAGLIQPRIAKQLSAGQDYEDVALWAVANYHPDLLVIQEGLFPRLEREYLANECKVIKDFPGEEYGYPVNLYIFACHG